MYMQGLKINLLAYKFRLKAGQGRVPPVGRHGANCDKKFDLEQEF